jgi:hypothetical protein
MITSSSVSGSSISDPDDEGTTILSNISNYLKFEAA